MSLTHLPEGDDVTARWLEVVPESCQESAVPVVG